MMNLANAYANRIRGERAENIEQAIAAYQEALQVRTRVAMPVDWATTMMNLAAAYSDRIRGERAENIEQAIAAYQQAIAVQTIELLPADHQRTQRNLGYLLFGEQCWAAAQAAYEAAVAAGQLLLDAAYTETGRQSEVGQTAQLYARLAYCSWQLGQPAAALRWLEQGKTRLLNQTLALGEVNLADLPAVQRVAIRALRQEIQALEGEARLPADTPARRDERQLANLLREARTQLRQQMQAIQSQNPHFMPGALSVTELLALVPENGVIVAPCITTQGSFAFVLPAGLSEITAEQIVPLPNLTETIVREWLVGSPTPEEPQLGGWFGAYAQRQANSYRWQQTISQTLTELWSGLMEPIYQRLQELNLPDEANVIIMPQGGLALLPLHAANGTVNGQPLAFGDAYTVTYAASGYALRTSQRRAQQPTRQQQSLLAVINPTQDLPYTSVEGDQVIASFSVTTPKTVLRETEATEAAVIAATAGKAYLHFSCHGFYNWQTPLESGLLLANKEILSLADILHRLDLGHSRLVVLSACETGMTDFRQTPDEFIGLPAAFLQAGAPGVVGTLWAVNDQSTSLLMDRFYQYHIQQRQPPATCLRLAQQWLRQATRQEIGDYYFSYITRMSADDAFQLHGPIVEGGEPDECPFAHPYHWAGFVYYGA
jgi:CHAT domain-containing protein